MQETKSRPAFYVFMYVYMCVCVHRSRFTCTHTRITKGPGSSRGTLVTLSISDHLDLGFQTAFPTESSQGSLEKWQIPGLGQEKYKMSPKHFGLRTNGAHRHQAACPHGEILIADRKEQVLRHMLCEKYPDPKDHTSCDFNLNCPEKEICRNRNQMSGFPELGLGRGVTAHGHEVCFLNDNKLKFDNQIVVVVAQFCKYTKSHQIVYFK